MNTTRERLIVAAALAIWLVVLLQCIAYSL